MWVRKQYPIIQTYQNAHEMIHGLKFYMNVHGSWYHNATVWKQILRKVMLQNHVSNIL